MSDAPPEVRATIRRAGPDEIEEAARIVEDAIRWSAELGFDSWTPGSFVAPDGWGRERLDEAQRSGGLYLVEREGEPAGTFSLLPEDRLFWPDAADDALYLHRFAVRRAHRGGDIGTAAMGFMRREVLREGRRFLRLDCLADNAGIRRYYERAGFEHRGDTVVHDIRFSLYELGTAAPEA